jgi:sugar phosphate isomerase/epimerase
VVRPLLAAKFGHTMGDFRTARQSYLAVNFIVHAREHIMPVEQPQVILSAFADEAANQKTAQQQFSALAAIGLQYYSLRFIDAGDGIKNVMKLTRGEITKIRHLEDEYGLNVTCIGSPIGKVKLVDKEDGTKNTYIPFKKYLAGDVKRACELAHAFETKLIRGFSFYHPRGTDPRDYLPQAVDQLGQIAEACHRSDLTYGLEIEANLIGQSGELMAEVFRQVNHPALALIFDAGNIISQGYTPAEVFQQYMAMKPGIGWIHIKDYHHPQPAKRQGHVDEDALKHFVPADVGDSSYPMILRDFRDSVPALAKKLKRRGIPGVFLDLEPHLKGGGQFGGFSGPDGLGVAARGLCRVLDMIGLGYHLRDFDDVLAARGK